MKEGTLSERAELLLIDDDLRHQSRVISGIEDKLDSAIDRRNQLLTRKKWLKGKIPESDRL